MTSQRKCGSQEAAVLLQEYLKGKEYIVDHVSRDGVHKTTLVWAPWPRFFLKNGERCLEEAAASVLRPAISQIQNQVLILLVCQIFGHDHI